MSKNQKPELKKYMDKKLSIRMNKGRKVSGVLRGYDQFLNLTLGDAVEHISSTEVREIGTVFVRGNSVEMIECLEPIHMRSK